MIETDGAVRSTLKFKLPARLRLFAASRNWPAETLTVAATVLKPVCVKIAVYNVPLPDMVPSVPPVTLIPLSVKSLAASESAKLSVTVSAALRKLLLLVIMMVLC